MTYKARVTFADLQDGRHLYRAGDAFPREGLTVSAKRLSELAGSDNRMGYPLIEAVEAPVQAADEAPEESTKQPAKAARKRPAGRQKDVSANADD